MSPGLIIVDHHLSPGFQGDSEGADTRGWSVFRGPARLGSGQRDDHAPRLVPDSKGRGVRACQLKCEVHRLPGEHLWDQNPAAGNRQLVEDPERPCLRFPLAQQPGRLEGGGDLGAEQAHQTATGLVEGAGSAAPDHQRPDRSVADEKRHRRDAANAVGDRCLMGARPAGVIADDHGLSLLECESGSPLHGAGLGGGQLEFRVVGEDSEKLRLGIPPHQGAAIGLEQVPRPIDGKAGKALRVQDPARRDRQFVEGFKGPRPLCGLSSQVGRFDGWSDLRREQSEQLDVLGIEAAPLVGPHGEAPGGPVADHQRYGGERSYLLLPHLRDCPRPGLVVVDHHGPALLIGEPDRALPGLDVRHSTLPGVDDRNLSQAPVL